MKASHSPVIVWAYSKPTLGLVKDVHINDDLAGFMSAINQVDQSPIVIAYMLPNLLKTRYAKTSVSQWKKFYKIALDIHRSKPRQVMLRPMGELIDKRHQQAEATFLASAYELRLLDPALFDIWAELEQHSLGQWRIKINAQVLAAMLEPSAPKEESSAAALTQTESMLLHRLHRLTSRHEQLLSDASIHAASQVENSVAADEPPQVDVEIRMLLGRLHSLQHRYDQLLMDHQALLLSDRPSENDSVSDSANNETIVSLMDRLHKLQAKFEAMASTPGELPQVERATDQHLDPEYRTWDEGQTEEHQRLAEQLVFVKAELRRQHAETLAYQYELMKLTDVMQAGNSLLLKTLT